MDDVVDMQRARRVLEGVLGIPATEGNHVEVLRNGDEIFPAMLDAIEGAHSTVDLATYVYWKGDIAVRFAELLARKAREGVRVRVLLDAAGAFVMDGDLVRQMNEAGCQVEKFRNPLKRGEKLATAYYRTHRKVLVVDEEIGFTGGVGIAEEWEGDAREPGEWRDTHMRIRGPAVDGLRAAFLDNWAETGRPLFEEIDRFPEQPKPGSSVVQVVSSGSTEGWTLLSTLFHALMDIAQSRLRISSAYFVPDATLLPALLETSRRGVQVQVLTGGENHDKRIVQAAGEDAYDELLEAGIEVWQYQPTMIHTKIMTVDNAIATVGSTNFDKRSIALNDESNLVLLDRDVAAELDRHFDEDLAVSTRLDPDSWRRRGPVQRTVESVTGLISEKL